MRSVISSTTLVSIAAGFAGGFTCQALFSPQSAFAQFVVPAPTRPQKRSTATEVDAQRFVLVDSSGNVTGEIKMDHQLPEIVLYDKQGQPAWRATTSQRGFQLLNAEP